MSGEARCVSCGRTYIVVGPAASCPRCGFSLYFGAEPTGGGK